MKGKFKWRCSIQPAALLGAALVLASNLALAQSSTDSRNSGKTIDLPVDDSPAQPSVANTESFAPVVAKVAPAVVKIVTARRAETLPDQQGRGMEDPFWRYFFGPGPRGRLRGPVERGLGSGVIVTKDGYILTNNHVVDNASEVKVTLQDGREFSAQVIGRDDKSDIAVVKIDATDLPTVPLANSQKVQVGDLVLAIGNPFGVGQTVTHGIVSATNRGGMGIEDYENFIQTDAPINPGNSGGALVDVQGRLVGINTAILSRTGGNMGIGFAIPSDLARTVMTSLIQYGRVIRGYLGIQIQDVTPALAKEFNLPKTTGALVGDVIPNGPADKAGFKDGDVITQFNGQPVRDGRQLQLAVAATKPGSNVAVQVLRKGSTQTLNATVGQLPAGPTLARNGSPNDQETGVLSGVAVSDLDNRVRQELNIPRNVQGAVITEVQPDSPAAQAGLEAGDVIESINRQPIKTAEQAMQLAETAKKKRTLLKVWSNGGTRYVVVDESETG